MEQKYFADRRQKKNGSEIITFLEELNISLSSHQQQK